MERVYSRGMGKPAIIHYPDDGDMFRDQSETDITNDIAIMFDAIVQSLDWGSDFLCTEEIEAIVKIGKLMGWKIPDDWEHHLQNSITKAKFQEKFGFPKKVR